MAKTPFNIQDQFLNQARKERIRLTISMMSGEKLKGYVKTFDSFSLLIESGGNILLYKHTITSITSSDDSYRLQGTPCHRDRRVR